MAAELLQDIFGLPIPEFESTTLEAADLNQPIPKEFRADAVIAFRAAEPELVAIVEVQLDFDAKKQWTWPLYLAVARERLKCPTALLVICTDPKIAKRCAKPIELGHPGLVLHPLVVGPDQIPLINDPQEAARTPALAVLSTLTHADGPEGDKALQGATGIYTIKDQDLAVTYNDILRAALSPASRLKLEALMKASGRPYLSEFANKHEARGEAKGEAMSILRVLANRGINVPDESRSRILECTDGAQLDTWLDRALTVGSVEELFA